MSLEKRIEALEVSVADIARQRCCAENISNMAHNGTGKSAGHLICQREENTGWHISVAGNALFKGTD